MRNRNLTAATILFSSLLLSACSSSSDVPEGGFITPAPPAETAISSEEAEKDSLGIGVDTPLGTNPPGNAVPVGGNQPFGVDSSNVEISEEITDIYGDASSEIVDDALFFMEVSSAVENRWTGENINSIDGYRAVEELMTPSAWDKLEAEVQAGDPEGLAGSLVPGQLSDGKLGDRTLPVQTPFTQVPQNVEVEVVQDEVRFGDAVARAKVDADVYSLFVDEDSMGFYGARHVTYYLLPLEQGWLVDSWEASNIVPVEDQ